jgi:hypothetical protein
MTCVLVSYYPNKAHIVGPFSHLPTALTPPVPPCVRQLGSKMVADRSLVVRRAFPKEKPRLR